MHVLESSLAIPPQRERESVENQRKGKKLPVSRRAVDMEDAENISQTRLKMVVLTFSSFSPFRLFYSVPQTFEMLLRSVVMQVLRGTSRKGLAAYHFISWGLSPLRRLKVVAR